MFYDETKNNDTQNNVESTTTTLKVYEKPTLMRLHALYIGTGNMNVPENDNGLLES